MEFLVLGPLGVRDRGQPVDIKAQKLRSLLVLLLLNSNRSTPADDLVEGLWEGSPPDSARASLHAYVYRLRRTLRSEGSDEILHYSLGGYRLEVALDSFDLYRFEKSVTAGYGALDADRLEEGVAHLRDALSLWRGPALADIDLETVRARVHQLEDQRVRAHERCLSAELTLGRHGLVVDELERLVEEHPLREGLWATLMMAHYHLGSNGEALQAYSRARHALVEDLGIEPGTELQLIQKSILAGVPPRDADTPRAAAPSVGFPLAAGVQQEVNGHLRGDRGRSRRPGARGLRAHRRVSWPVPAQLPPDTDDFTGRAAPVASLRDLLDRPQPTSGTAVTCGIFGPAGVGKTMLAIHAAHLVRHSYPDGQLFADLHGTDPRPTEPGQILASLLRSLGIPQERIPDAEADRAALFRTATAQRRVLLVLDDARDTDQVLPLLPSGSGCASIVTSRQAIATVPGVKLLRLDTFTESEALTLLTRIVGTHRSAGNLQCDLDIAAEIARYCDYLPLALRIVGARMAATPTLSWPALNARLADQRQRLSELHLDGLSVRTSLALSHRLLEEDGGPDAALAAHAFLLLSVLGGHDVTRETAARLLDVPAADAEAALEYLVRIPLLGIGRHERYRMHELVRLYAREVAAVQIPRHEQQAALRRVLGWHLATAMHATRLTNPASETLALDDVEADETGLPLHGPAEVFTWFETERTGLVRLILEASAFPPLGKVCGQLVLALARLFGSYGYGEDWEDVLQATLRACRDLDEHRLVGALLSELSLLAGARNDLRRAVDVGRDAYDAWNRAGDRTGRIRAALNLGVAEHRLGQVADAAATYEQVLREARAIGLRRGEAYSLANLAAAERDQGRPNVAILRGVEALEVFREIGDLHGQADALEDLATSYRRIESYRDAVTAHRRGLDVLLNTVDLPRRVHALISLAQTYGAAGDLAAAAAISTEAVEVSATIHDRHLRSQAQIQLAQLADGLPAKAAINSLAEGAD